MTDKMSNVIKKTNLGIAVQESIVELGLEREKNKIMGALQRAFEEKYNEFKQSMTNTSYQLKGFYVSDNEYPIGEGDKQQHFRCVAYQSRLNNNQLSVTLNGHKLPFTLIEAFSKNEENRKRSHSKTAVKNEAKMSAPRKVVKSKWYVKLFCIISYLISNLYYSLAFAFFACFTFAFFLIVCLGSPVGWLTIENYL